MARLISMAKTWPSILNKTKVVTRRDGWWDYGEDAPRLKEGEVIEAIQWSLRVGRRWICSRCGAMGGKLLPTSTRFLPGAALDSTLNSVPCDCASLNYGVSLAVYRAPDRGIFLRHVSSRREPLSALTVPSNKLPGTGTNQRSDSAPLRRSTWTTDPKSH